MEDPWFTYYRSGWHMQIVPRDRRGWIAMALFVVALVLPAFLLGPLFEANHWILAPYLILILASTIAWIRWAIRRSERIDLDEIAKDHAELKEWRRRMRRDGGR